jgi:hypothetical protein
MRRLDLHMDSIGGCAVDLQHPRRQRREAFTGLGKAAFSTLAALRVGDVYLVGLRSPVDGCKPKPFLFSLHDRLLLSVEPPRFFAVPVLVLDGTDFALGIIAAARRGTCPDLVPYTRDFTDCSQQVGPSRLLHEGHAD